MTERRPNAACGSAHVITCVAVRTLGARLGVPVGCQAGILPNEEPAPAIVRRRHNQYESLFLKLVDVDLITVTWGAKTKIQSPNRFPGSPCARRL